MRIVLSSATCHVSSNFIFCVARVCACQVTHLVIATDTALKVKVRSMKYFGALAQGSWIVAPAWLEDCLRKRGRRPEAAYEVISDGVVSLFFSFEQCLLMPCTLTTE